jgi:hypothetical protein
MLLFIYNLPTDSAEEAELVACLYPAHQASSFKVIVKLWANLIENHEKLLQVQKLNKLHQFP